MRTKDRISMIMRCGFVKIRERNFIGVKTMIKQVRFLWVKKKYNVTFGSSAGPQFRIYDEGAKACEKEYIENGKTYKTVDTSALEQFLLLKCRVNYKKDAFDLFVQEDMVNMFGGEKPTLHFEKRNRAEYLKEIGEEP